MWSISPFFNELDVLEVKLAEQAPYVDVFVFAEATRSYRGDPKPLHLTEALEAGRYAEWADKIRVVVVDDDPDWSMQPFQPFGDPQRWLRENHQRAALIRGMKDLEHSDLVCLSDLDEIVRGTLLAALREGQDGPAPLNYTVVPPLTMHVASLTHRWWVPVHVIARIFPAENILPCIDPLTWNGHLCGLTVEQMRQFTGHRIEIPQFQDMAYYGWHLSYMGGDNSVDVKLAQAAHPEYDVPQWRDPRHLWEVRAGRTDIFGRADRKLEPCPLAGLPDVIQQDFDRWQAILERGELVADPAH